MVKIKEIIYGTWSYRTGGIMLAVLNILMFAVVDRPWKITTGFTYWAAWLWRFLGGTPEKWEYFSENPKHLTNLQETVFTNELSVLDLGLIVGALLSILLVSQFKIRKIKSAKQAFAAISGGVLMGYGARVAMGCNIGAFFSSIPSLSLSGWLFGIFVFLGAWVGSKILIKYLL
ncbi:MAG: YeeE/YedE thiosulfate transporter family protein [Peptococcaceae bacterium]